MLKESFTREAVFGAARAQLERMLANSPGARYPIEEDSTFSDLGVSSLQLAELVSHLESLLEVDPFAEKVSITSVRSVADLCDAYLSCLGGSDTQQLNDVNQNEDELNAELRAARVRALERSA